MANMTTNAELIARFEQGIVDDRGFHHADHVRMAFAYLKEYPVLEAVRRFSSALKTFAVVRGNPQLYHETVTWAYLFLIRERMERTGKDVSWDEFAAANPDLLVWKNGVLDKRYRPEALNSRLAKDIFILPDPHL
jgi:hypothetical protein